MSSIEFATPKSSLLKWELGFAVHWQEQEARCSRVESQLLWAEVQLTGMVFNSQKASNPWHQVTYIHEQDASNIRVTTGYSNAVISQKVVVIHVRGFGPHFGPKTSMPLEAPNLPKAPFHENCPYSLSGAPKTGTSRLQTTSLVFPRFKIAASLALAGGNQHCCCADCSLI